ncbi:MAG: LysR substrate-binding domain-containing protein [Alphaproteobacteria bacterium]|nr:LysR substrate-binding domain-containing protein [Alphaproteobacteria bacterium]
MNLRDFHYLLAVADSLNFNRAAEACHVSQPTLSMQIKKLEEYLGVRMFERTNKNVRVTPAGRRVIEIARRIVQDERHIRDIAKELRNPAAGEFKLGAFPTLASYIFPTCVPAIVKKFPKLHLLLVEEKTDILLEKLKAGKIDAALLALPIDDAALQTLDLFNDPFLLAVGRDHPLAKKKSVRMADLSGGRLLLLDEGHCLRDQALAVCRAHGAKEENSFRATSLETLRLMVQAPHSGFMTLMPAIAVSPRDKLHYIPFRGETPARTIGIVWRKTDARAGMIGEMGQSLAAVHNH